MKRVSIWSLVVVVLAISALHTVSAQNASNPDMAPPLEKHLRNVHQLTFGGQNAEAYFSADGKKLIFQSSHGDVKCDQIFIMNIDGTDRHRTHHMQLLLSRWQEDSLCLYALGQPGVPAAS